jgi:hypothetical protein
MNTDAVIAKKAKETNNVVKTEAKEEAIPKKVQEAYDSLVVQVRTFNDQELHAGTMKTKGIGALEILVGMYPKLQDRKSEG